MLKKLLKYDLKWQYRILIPLYSISILFAIFSRILTEIGKNSAAINIISIIMTNITYIALANILINTITRTINKFITSIYKDEGYLTNTLPVTKKQIFLSKVLTSIITMVSSILIIILSLAIMFYSTETFKVLLDSLKFNAEMYNVSVPILITILAFTITTEFILFELIGFLGIILGHKSNDKKISKSIIYGLLIYFGCQVLMVGVIFIGGLFNKDIMTAITSNVINFKTIKEIILIADFAYLVFAIICYLIANREFNKDFNIE